MVESKKASSFNGLTTISFLDSKVENLSKAFDLTIVGKFAYGISKIFEVTKMLKEMRLKSSFIVIFMDKRHVDIKIFLEEDYNRLCLVDNLNVGGVPVRFLK